MSNSLIKTLRLLYEFSFYGLFFFLPISKALTEIFAVILLLGFIAKKIIKPDFKFLKFPFIIFLFMFVFFMCLSLFNSGEFFSKGLKTLLFKWLEYIGIFIIILDFITVGRRLRRAIFALLSGAILVSISGLFQAFVGIDFIRQRKPMEIIGGVLAITSTLNTHNAFAAYLLIPLSLITALAVYSKVFLKKLAYFSMFILFGTCLILTFSRGGWLGYLLALIFMFCLSKNYRFLLPIVLWIACFFYFPMLLNRLFFIFEVGGDADRYKYWQAAYSMIKENPILGKGLGTFMDYFPRFQPRLYISYAHNSYLQIWAESGIFSLISFLLFLVLLFKDSIKSFYKSKDRVILGFLGGTFGFLIHAFFDNHLHSLQLSILFWSCIAILAGAAAVKKEIPMEDRA